MRDYSHVGILINGREVSIERIVDGTASAHNDFEENTFQFIRDWLTDREDFVLSTSGSTGAPKMITITRKQMIASAEMTLKALGLRKDYTALLCISPDYIGGKMMLVRSLLSGMRIVAITPSSNPFNFLPDQLRIDFAAMVPYQIHEIVRSVGIAEKLNSIRTIIIGGAAIDEETEHLLQRYRCIFYSTYGMTETVSHIALRQLNGAGASDIYQTFPGINITVDERNCLVIEWSQLSDKIVTNDIVEIVKAGMFRWLGRWDNVINSGGLKIIPEKLEFLISEIFSSLAIANRFFVGSVPDTQLGSKVTLFVEGDLKKGLKETVEHRINQAILKREAPKQIVIMKSFDITENGKINRKATVKSYMARM